MFDVALSSAGAVVVLATSSDEKYPPENMIDGKPETFWTTTGLYPQEFIISFGSLMNLNNIRIMSANVGYLTLERSVQNEPVGFETIEEREVASLDGQLQNEEFTPSSMTAHHLKVTISKGYDHFCSVHQVVVDGNAVHS